MYVTIEYAADQLEADERAALDTQLTTLARSAPYRFKAAGGGYEVASRVRDLGFASRKSARVGARFERAARKLVHEFDARLKFAVDVDIRHPEE